MGTFQMPEFNFRLRRALNPFESGISPSQSAPKRSVFDSVGDTFADNAGWGDEEEDERLPPFSRAMPNFSSLYDKTGPATQRYQSHLSEVPNLKDYAPTKWRRLGAVLAGTSAALGGKDGYSKAREIVMDPYQTAYGDWEGRGAGLKESATLEENATAKKAALHQKILSDYMDSQDKGFDREVRWGTLQNQRDQTEIQQRRAEIEADRIAGVISAAEARNRLLELGLKQTGRYQQGQLSLGRERLDEDRRQGLDRAATGWYNAQTGRQRADSYDNYMDRPSYSSAPDMQRFEMDATREFLALNPAIAGEVDVDEYGRIDYESIDDPTTRAQIIESIKRGVAAKQRASMRPGR